MKTKKPLSLRASQISLPLLLALTLVACTTSVPYQKPAMDVPVAFKESAVWKIARPDAATVPDDWWQLFNDSALNILQAQVVVGNENLKSSAAQVEVARAALGSTRAGQSPTLGASAGITTSIAPGAANAATSNSIGANASWELDLWGRVSGAVSGAEARLQASSADLAAARLSVHALLTQTYFSLRSAESQAALLERSVTAFQRSLELTQNRYAGGVASAVLGDRVLDDRGQRLGGERLGDVVDDPHHLHEALAHLIALGRQQHHRHVAEVGIGRQLAAHLVAVELRHHEVEQDEVRAPGPGLGQAGLAVGGRRHVEAGLGQDELDHPDDGRAVVDDQDSGTRQGSSPCAAVDRGRVSHAS